MAGTFKVVFPGISSPPDAGKKALYIWLSALITTIFNQVWPEILLGFFAKEKDVGCQDRIRRLW
jgi:hypothetical protein